MRAMKDSGIKWIGEIPEEWEVCFVGKALAEVNNPNIDEVEKNTLQFKMGTIINKKYGNSKYSPESIESYNIVTPGVIMINGLNLSFDLVSQRVALVKEKGAITSTYLAMIPKSKQCQSEYTTYLLKAYDDCKALHAMGRGLRATLSYSTFSKELILLPPLSEQQRIATYLDTKCGEIDELIGIQERFIEELKAYKQSVITEAVTKGLNPNAKMKDSGVEWIGEIPEGWGLTQIGKIFKFLGGYPYNSDVFVTESNNQVIRIGNVKNDCLKLAAKPVFIDDKLADQTKNFEINPNTILFTMTGTKGKRDYFFTLVVPPNKGKEKFFLNQRVGCFIPLNNVNPYYYNFLFKDSHILDSIFLYETGTANQGNLGIETIRRTKLQYPPIKEQDQIAEFLRTKCSQIDSLITLKQTKIDELKSFKKSLIYEYVTGKKTVPESV